MWQYPAPTYIYSSNVAVIAKVHKFLKQVSNSITGMDIKSGPYCGVNEEEICLLANCKCAQLIFEAEGSCTAHCRQPEASLEVQRH